MKLLMISAGLILFVGPLAMSQGPSKPVLVASFPVLPTTSVKDGKFEPNSLYMTQVPNELGRNVPSFILEGAKFAINDEASMRAFWLDDTFQLKSVSHYEVWGKLQVDGNHVLTSLSYVQIWKDTLQSEVGFLVEIPNVKWSMYGGAWYQADTLFFWDDQGKLYVVEHPVNRGPNGVGIPLESIKTADEVKRLLVEHPERYPALVWSDRYGLTRHGYPLCQSYNRDWQNFLQDQRQNSPNTSNPSASPIPASWFNAIKLAQIGDDGTLYWGGFGSYAVTQNGSIVATVEIPHSRPSKALPNGNIVFMELKGENRLELYQFRRWW